jgi:hypothetical protein
MLSIAPSHAPWERREKREGEEREEKGRDNYGL